MTDKQGSFEQLAHGLRSRNEAFQQSAACATNKHVTCRNWLNGYYIVHYEQNGSDRAKYGENSYVIQNSKISQSLIGQLDFHGISQPLLERTFYEIECIKGVWSTRELKRQIDSGFFSKNMMQPGDSPPIGILLCTAVGKEMVEYATSGVDEHLFVAEYMLKLPSTEELRKWLVKELKELR